MINLVDGGQHKIYVKYLLKPDICSVCECFGHSIDHYDKHKEDIEKDKVEKELNKDESRKKDKERNQLKEEKSKNIQGWRRVQRYKKQYVVKKRNLTEQNATEKKGT